MELVMKELDLKTEGMTESQTLVEFRRFRRRLFNEKMEYYPVLQNGEYIHVFKL
jgi:hypothetical protein